MRKTKNTKNEIVKLLRRRDVPVAEIAERCWGVSLSQAHRRIQFPQRMQIGDLTALLEYVGATPSDAETIAAELWGYL